MNGILCIFLIFASLIGHINAKMRRGSFESWDNQVQTKTQKEYDGNHIYSLIGIIMVIALLKLFDYVEYRLFKPR